METLLLMEMRLRSQAGGSGCSLGFDPNLGLGAVANVTTPKPWIPMAGLPPSVSARQPGVPATRGVAGVAFPHLWAQRGRWWPAGAARAPGPQEVGGSPEGQLPTGVVSTAHTARSTAARERYSMSTSNSGASEGCPWSAGGARVTRGQKPGQGTSNQAEKEKCHEDTAREQFPALLNGSLTIALHLNSAWLRWGEKGEETFAPGRLRGRTLCPQSLQATATATATGTVGPSPEASSDW